MDNYSAVQLTLDDDGSGAVPPYVIPPPPPEADMIMEDIQAPPEPRSWLKLLLTSVFLTFATGGAFIWFETEEDTAFLESPAPHASKPKKAKKSHGQVAGKNNEATPQAVQNSMQSTSPSALTPLRYDAFRAMPWSEQLSYFNGKKGEGQGPYTNLPNPRGQATSSEPLDLTTAKQLLVDLTDARPWKRYKTVLTIKENKYQKAGLLLKVALDDKKLWTRMLALSTISDSSSEISDEMFKKALGSAEQDHPYLLTHYLKRFYENPSPGQSYLMRELMAFVGERNRIMLLGALIRHAKQDEANLLYVVAAQYDSSQKVRQWLHRHQPKIPKKRLEELREIVVSSFNQINKSPSSETTPPVAISLPQGSH